MTPVDQPPAATQGIGTGNHFGPPGSVLVRAAPGSLPGRMLRVSRPTGPEVAGFQGKFAQFRGDGVYTFSATMFMPSQSGVATVQFETFDNPVSSLSAFLHLDFMPNNTVRIDDNAATTFGSFQRDQPFIVQVTLRIGAPTSTARIILSGAAANGEADHTILAPFQASSRNFGAIRIWQGFPHTGAIHATNVAVTRRAP